VQRYTVNARKRQVEAWQRGNEVREVSPGLYLLTNKLMYDRRFGLLVEGKPLDAQSLVQ
jgi:hypothetical protein